MAFVSERVSQSANIFLNGHPDNIFPLFGPVREMEWAPGWAPEIIFGNAAKIEERIVFQTRGNPEEEKYTWTISRLDPIQHLIEYTVFTQNRIWFIRVACVPQGERTRATVSYSYTGLTNKGNELNRNAMKEMFSNELMDWQEAVNYYLSTGKRLEKN